MKPYPLDNTWSKGHYVARITGPHARYVVEREFLRGRPIKTRGVVEYTPDDLGTLPAWIVRAPQGPDCGGCGRPTEAPKELIAAHPHGWEVTARGLSSTEILAVFQMGAPGDPDAWTGKRCPGRSCGKPLPADVDRCEPCKNTDANREAAKALAGEKVDPF